MKNKIIEQMAKDIRPVLENRVDIGFIPDLDKPIAKTLIEQGYRKVNKDECEYWKSRCKEIGDVAYEKARKDTAEKILKWLVETGVINTASDTTKMYFKEEFGVEVEE